MGDPDALVLTAIGIGTAFGVLVLLLVTVLLIRLVSWAIDKFTGDDKTPVVPVEATDPENRNRAARRRHSGHRAHRDPTPSQPPPPGQGLTWT